MSLEDSIKKLKEIDEELREMENTIIYVQGEEYVPSGNMEFSLSIDYEFKGNPFCNAALHD